jgi:hypothetical protein
VSGGAVVPNGLWPGFDGAYLFGDCTCGGIFRISGSGPSTTAADFGLGLGPVIHLAFGPFGSRQALYYATFTGGGQIRRITGPTGNTRFFSVTPSRVVDTRQAPGPTGGPALAAGSQRTFPVAGTCSVPATATAVAINVSVTSPTAGGNLTFFADGTALPSAVTLNFSAGQTRSNNAVSQLGAQGGVAVFYTASGPATVHVIVDVVGYFE